MKWLLAVLAAIVFTGCAGMQKMQSERNPAASQPTQIEVQYRPRIVSQLKDLRNEDVIVFQPGFKMNQRGKIGGARLSGELKTGNGRTACDVEVGAPQELIGGNDSVTLKEILRWKVRGFSWMKSMYTITPEDQSIKVGEVQAVPQLAMHCNLETQVSELPQIAIEAQPERIEIKKESPISHDEKPAKNFDL